MLCYFFTYVTIFASSITAIRLITYRMGNNDFNRKYSVAAYVLMVCCGSQAIYLMAYPHPVGFWQAGTSVLLMTAMLLSKGNVAVLFKGCGHHEFL